jgi:hypothetical protein
LCWPIGAAPLPIRTQDHYRWIHTVILEALRGVAPLRMAACADTGQISEPFAERRCFSNPVGFDLLRDRQKVVGGALARTRRAVLYQGSIQIPVPPSFENDLQHTFAAHLGQPAC